MLDVTCHENCLAPGLLNQTEVTRVVLKPAVQTYNTALDSGGRPSGWNTVSPAQTVDVPITLDEYVGVPIVFGNDILASTFRKLFNEITPQALCQLQMSMNILRDPAVAVRQMVGL